MIEFKILKKSKRSNARLGLLKTDHGLVETPSLVPVATQAVVKTLTSEEAAAAKSQILIANTFHLHLKPGEKVVRLGGGLHTFMNWKRPLMTDSGGFQVFSLGFGRDSEVGKFLKYFSGEKGKEKTAIMGGAQSRIIQCGAQPKYLKITDEGVRFRSPLTGETLFIDPKASIRIQEALGADIIFAFDECTSPLASYEYVKQALARTHQWAEICVRAKKSSQALFGIVQGSRFKDLREESARFINALDFAGFGIGGDLGESKRAMRQILRWSLPLLDKKKPRHLLGVGHLEDMEQIIKEGIDLFDCTAPTHYARRGVAFVRLGRLNLRRPGFLKDKKPLDPRCLCFTCQNYRRNYIAHLMRANEITAMKLLTFHNLYYFNSVVEGIRKKIKEGKL